ncbi:hypothetical protein [Streptomyces qinzhouensis]|uniref:Uncharacterized protein n=1 Tax=Streptomyces qinzhouensis TaxID=2599401 RepID=A0A5B8JFU8_9ACTN|nr:hypothetical protein [Streptomyces qinzhouensis]QDY79164.1 hypothetical protein FQU76_24540 [Streptomyces qinzhouensis]
MSEYLVHTHSARQASALRREELIRQAEEYRLARLVRRAGRRAARNREGRVTAPARYVPAA